MSYELARDLIRRCKENRSKKLDLSGLDLAELPAELFDLQHLTTLYLGNQYDGQLKFLSNRLRKLPDEFANLKKLQFLYFEKNELTEFPEVLTQLENLREFDLSSNYLENIPESFTLLKNLRILHLNDNLLSNLPESITRIRGLKQLDISSNHLTTIPDSITQLIKLQRLYITGNQLSVFPESLTRLLNLQVLYLSNNSLSTLPNSLAKLTNLQRLSLDSNQFYTLPEAITSLDKLQRLYIDNNHLRVLPESIALLQKLLHLSISNNELSHLPESITQLINLQRLYLSENQLRSLPDSIAKLTNLIVLALADNRIIALPKSIVCLQRLEHLYIQHNPLLYPPEPIAARGIGAVQNYLEKFGEPDHLYEAKLLLVGEGRVGKTSLAKTLALPGYQLADESSTEGIAIRTWIIPKEELGTEKDFRLNVWDFGGQEIYHATHQFFLTRRSLYLLVTESRKEDKHEDFYYWLNIIRLLGDRSPVLLVLNKCDQPTKELPFNEYRQRFPALSDYLKVSCAVGFETKIEDLRQTIYRVLRDPKLMAHIGAPLPKVWVTVREEIEQLRLAGRNHISRDEYMAICTQHEVDDVTAGVLGDYFHDLGIFLYFRDDIELEETIFLNYGWVTDAVYKVLDNPGVKARYGRFSPANLQEIWSDAKYRSKRRELLALMKNRKFELCYELPNGDYLAPQLLPVDEQPYAWRSPNENLHFEYRYEFMPKGILSRFIVKRHPDIFQQTHWRYGVLLEWANTRALVRERYFDRKLTIVLEGQNKRDFLQIIRKSVEEIHDSFENLDVAEMVPCHCVECQKSESPHFYKHELLNRYRQKGIRSIRCEKSLEDVDVQRLINDVFPPPPRERFGEEEEREWREEILRRGGTYIDTQIVTNGGSVIQGDANIGGNLVGRDQHLT